MGSSKDTEAVVQRHIDAFARGDVPALLADYTHDVTFLSALTGEIKGRAALEQLYVTIFRDALPPATTQIMFGQILALGDVAIVPWDAVNSSVRTQGATDVFVVRDNKIVAQIGAGAFVPIGAK
jgi:ketosteroid isomerase-like protein